MNSIITGNGGRYWDAIQGQWVETEGYTQLDHVNGYFSSFNSLYGSDWNSFTPYSSSNDLIYSNGVDPFVDQENNNFQLSDISAAIGGGTSFALFGNQMIFAPFKDIFSNDRPNPSNSEPDIGAIENELAVRANTVFTVKQDETGDFSSISQALDQIGVSISYVPGDTILVYPGTYVNNLLIEKAIVLKSLEGPEVTILDGNN